MQFGFEEEPMNAASFEIEIKDHLTLAQWTSASGLNLEVEVIESNENIKGGKIVTKKRPGPAKFDSITLKRLLTVDKSAYEWVKKIRDGSKDYKVDGALVMYDRAFAEIGRWTFSNAWPSKWSCSDLDVGTNDPMSEEITLVIEHLVREK
jgi:phage tail-like protein